ncbi:MAG: sulfotransferase family protein [Proteobacteria bacterium]|nr:sulfotransferase family protein [Pseudomonadota bacterium]
MIDQCLLVLGMHRSGTSCLTGIIQQCGVELGEVFTENPFNRKGNRESAAVQALNNQVLEANGGAWNQPVDIIHWSAEQRATRDAIIADLRARASRWWGFKDPRVLLTLPFWLEALASPRFIGTFRHPHRVALSLNHRDGMPFDDAYALWLAYNQRLIACQSRFGFQLVDFDLPEAGYREDVEKKLEQLGLESAETLFFDSQLRHQTAEETDVVLPMAVQATYDELRRLHGAV